MRSLLSGVCLACGVAARVQPQVITPAQCAGAAAHVNGRALPAVNDSTFSAWYGLAACGSTGEAAAVQALGTASVIAETDSTRVQEFVTLFYGRRTAAFFNALQAVILSPQASDIFKREAIAAYGGLYLPGYAFSTASANALNAPACGSTRSIVTTAAGPLSNLPSDFLNQMVTTMSAAASNSANSDVARGLAQCWKLRLQLDVPPIGSKIQLAYVCGDTFRVANVNTAAVAVTADVIPPNVRQAIEHRHFMVQGGGVFTFQTQIHGTVRLSFDGAVIQTKPNGATVCH